jgi:glyceraldehyde-3-phosphate dehydrogenase (NADP+)
MRSEKLHVAGGFEDGAGKAIIASPWDGRPVAEVAQAGPGEVERALAAAVVALPAGRRSGAGERRQVLERIARAITERTEELAGLIVEEAGKPLRLALAEARRAAETFSQAAAEVGRFGGEVLPIDFDSGAAGYRCLATRVASGVVVGISPFNFPLNLAAHKVAPAIAVGAPIVLKPPPQAPSAALRLAAIAKDAGLPAGMLSVLPCENALAEKLATDPRPRVLSFTGSAKVGWMLRDRAGRKRVIVEGGGNAGVAIAADADLDWAAQRCALGAFAYAGQVCIKVQRIVAVEEIHDAFLPRFLSASKALRAGDPADPEVLVGPVIDDAAAARIEAWVKEAQGAGARVLLGGTREGRRVAPTVLAGVPPTAKVWREEIFGPVVAVERARDFEEALSRVDDSPYGLQAGVFTYDLRRVRRAFERLEVGGVIVNDTPTFRTDNMPYGGMKDSGLGREGVRYAMEEMSEPKTLVVAAR